MLDVLIKIFIIRNTDDGRLAQLVERLPYTQNVSGSSPLPPTNLLIIKLEIVVKSYRAVVVQLVRIPACHAGGRGFESRPLRQSSY